MDARAKALTATGPADAARKEGQLTQALGRLFALAENYPNLKSNENVKMLQEELSSTENKVGFARQFYNDIATRFNTAQQVFPDQPDRGAVRLPARRAVRDHRRGGPRRADRGSVMNAQHEPLRAAAANRRRTWLVMAAFVALLLLLGVGFDAFYLGEAGGSAPVGSLVALAVGSVSALVSYFSGDRAVLPRDRTRGRSPSSSAAASEDAAAQAASARQRRRRDGDRGRAAEAGDLRRARSGPERLRHRPRTRSTRRSP